MKTKSVCLLFVGGLVILFNSAGDLRAGSPVFPWHAHQRDEAPVGKVPVQVLGRPATSPVTVLPSKQAYPYGWFGADPSKHIHLHWHRSFGPSKTYTQWTKY